MAEMMRPVARDDLGPYVTLTGVRLRGAVLEGLNAGDQVEIISTPDDSPFGLSVAVVTSEGPMPVYPDGGGEKAPDGDCSMEAPSEQEAADDGGEYLLDDDNDDDPNPGPATSDGLCVHGDGHPVQPPSRVLCAAHLAGLGQQMGAIGAAFDRKRADMDDDCDDTPAPLEVGAKVRPGDFTDDSPHRQLVHTRTAPLTVPLSEEAMHALEGELAEANIALLDEEEEAAKLAEALKIRKAGIKALKADVDQLTRDRRAGTREIEVETEVWSAFDLQPPQRVTIRTDTMEIVALSPIEDSDRQTKIPAKAPTLQETLGEPKTGPTLTVIVGGKEEWEGDEIPDDEPAEEGEEPAGNSDPGADTDDDEIPF